MTFNLVQKHRGGHKIEPRSAEYPIRGRTYSPPRKPSEIPASGGFRFVGPRIQFSDYAAIYSIAKSVIQPSEKAPVRQPAVFFCFRVLKCLWDKSRRCLRQRWGRPYGQPQRHRWQHPSPAGRGPLWCATRPAPPDPPRTSVQRVCLFCLMDKSTYSMDMMDNLTG